MADKSKDTGTGGINIDGKVQTMDIGDPAAAAPPAINYSSGDIAVDKTIKDISRPTRETFAKYLSKTTLAQAGDSSYKNVYPVGSGEDTTLQEIKLKDDEGNPTSPGPQNNESKFAEGFNQLIASNNPANIRRGLKTGEGVDGNKLLPDAAAPSNAGGPYVKPSDGLNENLTDYTKNVLDPNLYSPLDINPELVNVTIGDGGDVPAANIRDLYKTTNIVTDGGTSENIVKKTFVDESILVSTKTTVNTYPVSSPVVNDTLNVFKLDSAAVLAKTGNDNYFADIKIGSSAEVNSKGKLTRKSGTETLPDGNKLLPDASTKAPSDGDYIKFVATTDNTGLQQPIKRYTNDAVALNLFDFNSPRVVLTDGTLNQQPQGVRNIKILPSASTPETEGGTSKNILGDDGNAGDYTLTTEEQKSLAGAATINNKFAIEGTTNLVTFRGPAGEPVSVTNAQINFANVNFFTKRIKIVGEGENQHQEIYAADLSSYTSALISAKSSVTDPFRIKRGKESGGDGPDGHELLPNIAPEKDGSAILTAEAKTYTNAVIRPNLRDYSSYTSTKKTANQSGDAQDENLYDLYPTVDLATDGGTSENVLESTNAITFASASLRVNDITKNNYYQVDQPIVNDSLNTFKLDSSANLVSTSNKANFADVKIGVSDSFTSVLVNSKGKLIKTDNNVSLPNGNVLLISGSTKDTTSADYIKFVKTNGNNGLQGNLKSYTQELLKKNLFNFDTSLVGIVDGTIGLSPSGVRDIKTMSADSTVENDGGTSKNILNLDNNEGKYTLTLLEQQSLAGTATVGNFFPIDFTTTLVTLRDNNNDPISVTAAQQTITNAKFFTQDKVNNTAINLLGSSYSNAYIKATKKDLQNPLSRFSIKRGKVKEEGEDGNVLLSKATAASTVAGPYIKFTALNTNVYNYTVTQLANNLYKAYDSVASNDKSTADPRGPGVPPENLGFFGPRQLHRPISGTEDAGTFDNISTNPNSRAVTKQILFQRAVDEVKGVNAPGSVGNNYKPNDSQVLFNFTTDKGYPISATEAQDSVASIEQYVLPSNEAGYVKLQSSYSNEVADSGLDSLIKRGKTNKNAGAPDGNTLLKNAAPAVAGASFVKTTAERSPAIDAYVTSVLRKNRYNPASYNQFVPADTPGAQSIYGVGPDGSKGGQDLRNISDDVGSTERSISFVERAKLYSPSQLKLGESPQSTINNAGEEIQGYTFRRLTRIGTILQLRAAGEIVFTTGADDDDPRSNTQQLGALLPGLGQAGAGIPLSRELLNVRSIVENLVDENEEGGVSSIPQYEGELIDISRNFEGVVNTALEKFAGFSAIGLLVLAVVLVAVIILVFWGLIGLIAAQSSALNKGLNKPGGKAEETSNKIRGLGTFQGKPVGGGTNIIADIVRAVYDKSAATALFGIKPTYNREYQDAVYRGALAFFGLGATPPPLLSYPGQVIVTSRAIVRGVAELTKAFIDIGNAFATGNIFSAIFKIIDIIEIIRNSKIIRALNTFSQLGDRRVYSILGGVEYKKPDLQNTSTSATPTTTAAGSQDQLTQDKTQGLFASKELYEQTNELDVGVKISEIDAVINDTNQHNVVLPAKEGGETVTYNKDYVGISQVKSRLNGSRALAWSSYRSPSLLLDPHSNMPDVLKKLPGAPKKKDIPDSQSRYASTSSITAGRISTSLVKQYEAALDGEYMPFYFQDLRTNEILNFHAFLLSLNDDYTASYESVTGLGRIEPIRIYKDTQRKIGLSFLLAALDDDDFDHMWEKINKLTMMVYPQFTQGKKYRNPINQVEFEKPFTQMIAAGPMVRLRLGNLFRSNYSKFNIAGIFGLDSPGARLSKQIVEAPGTDATDKADLIGQTTELAKRKGEEYDNNPSNKHKPNYLYSIKAAVYKTTIDEKTANERGIPVAKEIPLPSPPKAAPNPPPPDPNSIPEGNKEHFKGEGNWYQVFDGDKNLRFKITKSYPENEQVKKAFLGTFVATSDATDEQKKYASPAGKSYYVMIEDLVAIDANSQKQYDADKAAYVNEQLAPESAGLTVNAFLQKENNAIVRAFESTGGKGLAGFIETISFDWYSSVTWDTVDKERKAPKMCKITISYSPVHDITPGLNSFGLNRAPIYPLGPYRRLDNET